MIHLIVTVIVTACVTLLKGILSVVGFLLKLVGRVLRLLLSALPVTGTALLFCCGYLVWFSFTGTNPFPTFLPYVPNGRPFLMSLGSLLFMVRDLAGLYPGIWGTLVLIAAVVLAVPVLLALLLSHAAIALFPVMIILLAAELAVYVIYGIFSGKTPFLQIRDRYFALFPKSANRHYEKNYHAWLRRHADEFSEDRFGYPRRDEPLYDREYDRECDEELFDARRRRVDRRDRKHRYIEDYYDEPDDARGNDYAYEPDYDDRADYDEDEYDDESVYDDDRYDDGGYDDGGYDDDRYDDEDEYDDDAEETPVSRSAFDFFAGCRDRAGVEKKYRSLVKIYHPDNQDGDTSAIQEINAQYAEAKRKYR
ncbi:MAG: hypothetical protein K5696_10985 [Lachnospiraceae bacterium]|nr:hypothetical protein [Lachnospiraceae bacterium]